MKRILISALLAAALMPAAAIADNGLCNDPFDCNGRDDAAPAHKHAKLPKKLTMAAARKAVRYTDAKCTRESARQIACYYQYWETEFAPDGSGRESTGRLCWNNVVVRLPRGSRTPVVSSAEGTRCEYTTRVSTASNSA